MLNIAICRACLSDNKNALRPLSSIRNLFTLCTGLVVLEDDDLPTSICDGCVYKCHAWESFKSQCMQSEQTLRREFISRAHYKSLESTTIHTRSSKSKEETKKEKNSVPLVTVEKDWMESIDCNQFIHGSPKLDVTITKQSKTNDSQFICDKCNISFRKKDRLEAHFRTEHLGLKPEVCKICTKGFNNLRALRRHRLKHNDIKQYKCVDCGKMYKYQTSLTLHKKSHQNIRRFVCDLCGKSFLRAHGLQSHQLTHSTETPFDCEQCGKKFKNQVMLRNHQTRHDGVKKFVCSDCGMAFITSAEMRTHARSHTGEKPFKCDMCDKTYKTKSHLSVHSRIHSGIRPYPCDLCPLKFAHNKVLKQHRLTHTGEMPHSCGICNRPFRQKSTLNVHMRTHAKETTTQTSHINVENKTTIHMIIS